MEKKLQFILYIIFAIISTFINIATQVGVESILLWLNIDGFSTIIFKNITINLFIKMSIATIVAFVFKFIVDKIIIFKDKAKEVKENLRQVIFYGFFAVFTTFIFWGTELFFKFFFSFPFSEYVGAVIGLTIGYTVKFLLDRKFVFNNKKLD
ncbi:MAG: hypothetical protein A2086_13215 [Spirochaetes bacterium GWD1_27_9]|nr:MAG: hypothetical protein A2Y34_14240 [Spirochaetes bacterium GWC1_27_15]OHD44884.1 MAG: hypothetical protein A2086_13215 [Spirochaetes bacterium GWD1_27_9]